MEDKSDGELTREVYLLIYFCKILFIIKINLTGNLLVRFTIFLILFVGFDRLRKIIPKGIQYARGLVKCCWSDYIYHGK